MLIIDTPACLQPCPATALQDLCVASAAMNLSLLCLSGRHAVTTHPRSATRHAACFILCGKNNVLAYMHAEVLFLFLSRLSGCHIPRPVGIVNKTTLVLCFSIASSSPGDGLACSGAT